MHSAPRRLTAGVGPFTMFASPFARLIMKLHIPMKHECLNLSKTSYFRAATYLNTTVLVLCLFLLCTSGVMAKAATTASSATAAECSWVFRSTPQTPVLVGIDSGPANHGDSTRGLRRYFARHVSRDSSGPSQRQPVAFQMMARLTNGGLEGIRKELASIGSFSDVLLISGLHPQTVESMPDGRGGFTINHFGYWPSDHGSINPALGSFNTLRQLSDDARQKGMRVMVDAVPAHFGYEAVNPGDSKPGYVFNGKHYKELSEFPEEIFRTRDEIQAEDWNRLESLENPQQILSLWDDVFARKRLFGLPGFSHRKLEVQSYLIESYKKFIDAGVTGFRIDAALYIDRKFVSEFINQLSAYSRSKGQSLHFYVELLVHKNYTLKVMGDDILSRVAHKEEVFFLDFPLMTEVRRGINPGEYGLAGLIGFSEYRQRIGAGALQLLPTLVNHDFGYPFNAPGREAALYALSGFMDGRSTLILAGTENSSANRKTDSIVTSVDANGAVGTLNSALGQHLRGFRKSPLVIEKVGGHNQRIVLSRSNGPTTLLLFVGMDAPGAFSHLVPPGGQFTELLKSPTAEWSLNDRPGDRKIDLKMGQADFILIEVKH